MIQQAEPPALTPRQADVYQFIVNENRRGIMPTIIEIGKKLGMRSHNTVVFHLTCLEEKGYIIRSPNKARTIKALGVIDQESIAISPGEKIQAGSVSVECTAVKNGQAQLIISRTF